MSQGYSTADAARIAGMTLRQVRYLATSGVVPPSVSPGSGRGFPALYAFSDLVKLAAIQRLRATSGGDPKVERLREIAAAIDRDDPAGSRLLVVDDTRSWFLTDELQALLDRGQAILLISLEVIERTVRLELARHGIADTSRPARAAA